MSPSAPSTASTPSAPAVRTDAVDVAQARPRVRPLRVLGTAVLALLSDGEAWSSSSLALALGVSPRTVLRALERLAEADKVESFGRGRACRWIARSPPGFPTSLLLPAAPPGL